MTRLIFNDLQSTKKTLGRLIRLWWAMPAASKDEFGKARVIVAAVGEVRALMALDKQKELEDRIAALEALQKGATDGTGSTSEDS